MFSDPWVYSVGIITTIMWCNYIDLTDLGQFRMEMFLPFIITVKVYDGDVLILDR